MSQRNGRTTDLGAFYESKGARTERARIVAWLGQVAAELSVEPTVTENKKGENFMTVEEKSGALQIIGVLIENLKVTP